MFNKVTILGHATFDGEFKAINQNNSVYKNSIATNYKYNVNGQQKEETCFFEIECWNGLAQVCSNYIKKGSKLFVEGRMIQQQWQDQQTGQQRSKYVVRVETLKILDGQNNNQNGQQPSNYGNAQSGNIQPQTGNQTQQFQAQPAQYNQNQVAANMQDTQSAPQSQSFEGDNDEIPF